MDDILICESCKNIALELHECPTCEMMVCSACHDINQSDPRCMACLEVDANRCHYDAYDDED